jgi:glycosyltransferase involved in cell wall biosynthesis
MSDPSPLISVIVPVYNGAEVLTDCLMMLGVQNYSPLEIIVIDNNSTDQTSALIEQAKQNDPRIRSGFESYRSRGAARQAALQLARGEIVVTINVDCVFEPNWLERLAEPIRSGQAEAVNGNSYFLKTNYWAKQADLANTTFLERQVVNGFCTCTIDTKNFAIKAEILKSVGFNPQMKTMDDFDLFLRLKNRCQVRFLPEVKVGDKQADTFGQTVKTNFERAVWTYRIYRHYQPLGLVDQEIMFESISWQNFLSLPAWLIWQSLHQAPGRSFYSLISELAWRAGLAYAWLKPGQL